jgi:hypothetical protein
MVSSGSTAVGSQSLREKGVKKKDEQSGTLLVLAEPGAGLPPHLLQQPESDVGGAEVRVDGRLLEPLRVEVLRGAVAHRQPELLQILLLAQIQAAARPLLGRLPALLLLRDIENEVRHADPETSSRLAAGRAVMI